MLFAAVHESGTGTFATWPRTRTKAALGPLGLNDSRPAPYLRPGMTVTFPKLSLITREPSVQV
jgi:hypothetical protein